jgi:class 3 adenylate cyclase
VLKRRLGVDDDELEDLKEDLIYAKKLAVDEGGHVLVWTGNATAEPPTISPSRAPDQAPLAYTPAHLTEKVLASRAALEGERKQVTVLFADIKDSTEIIRNLDPETVQQLLDPAIHRMMEAAHRCEGTVNQVLGDGGSMGLLQAHCHRGLGPLHRQTGQREQARAALTAAIDLYCALDMTF